MADIDTAARRRAGRIAEIIDPTRRPIPLPGGRELRRVDFDAAAGDVAAARRGVEDLKADLAKEGSLSMSIRRTVLDAEIPGGVRGDAAESLLRRMATQIPVALEEVRCRDVRRLDRSLEDLGEWIAEARALLALPSEG